MSKTSFSKILTANDTGESGGHQAGIHIPKGEKEFLDFLPKLDSGVKNPDAWLECIDENENKWSFRFVYYNNKLHDENGTRDEYRITHMTKYVRSAGARQGNIFTMSRCSTDSVYTIKVAEERSGTENSTRTPIRLKGWTRIH